MFAYEIDSMTLEQILFHLILVLLFIFFTSFSRFILRFISLFGKLAVWLQFCFCFLYMSITCGHLRYYYYVLKTYFVCVYACSDRAPHKICGLSEPQLCEEKSTRFYLLSLCVRIKQHYMRSVMRDTARCQRSAFLTIRRLLLRTSVTWTTHRLTRIHWYVHHHVCCFPFISEKNTSKHWHTRNDTRTPPTKQQRHEMLRESIIILSNIY